MAKVVIDKETCGRCGQAYGRKVWNSTNDKLKRVIWQCNGRYKKKGVLLAVKITIVMMRCYKAFIVDYNAVVENIEHLMAKWKEQIESENMLTKVTAKGLLKYLME